jgi:hypothetical protein
MTNFPPVRWVDLVALGLDPGATISNVGGASIDPPAGWLVARVLALAVASSPPEENNAYCRHVRDLVLAATDWTQAADSPLSESQRAAWATYRQSLRDLPSVYSGEGPIPWPQEPA